MDKKDGSWWVPQQYRVWSCALCNGFSQEAPCLKASFLYSQNVVSFLDYGVGKKGGSWYRLIIALGFRNRPLATNFL